MPPRRFSALDDHRLRVVHFEQTHLNNARQISRLMNCQGGMTMPKNDKYKDYARYAEQCLNMVASTRDQELRSHSTRNGRRMAKTSGCNSAPS